MTHRTSTARQKPRPVRHREEPCPSPVITSSEQALSNEWEKGFQWASISICVPSFFIAIGLAWFAQRMGLPFPLCETFGRAGVVASVTTNLLYCTCVTECNADGHREKFLTHHAGMDIRTSKELQQDVFKKAFWGGIKASVFVRPDRVLRTLYNHSLAKLW